MEELKELYAAKGEATTQLEIWQGKLNNLNQKIVEILNKPPVSPPAPKPE